MERKAKNIRRILEKKREKNTNTNSEIIKNIFTITTKEFYYEINYKSPSKIRTHKNNFSKKSKKETEIKMTKT